MDFLEIAKKRQSTRNFDPSKKVPQELLERSLSAMVLSPSACNAQPYFYYVLEGKKAKKAAKLTGKMNAFSKDAPVIIAIFIFHSPRYLFFFLCTFRIAFFFFGFLFCSC